MRKIFVIVTSLFIVSSIFGQVPDTSCFNAGVFCNEEDFESTIFTLPDTIPGMTSLTYPKKLCPEGGQPNNIMYFNFVPSGSTVTIQINSLGCDEGFNNTDLGYQWGVYDSCDEIFETDPNNLICEAFMNGSDGWLGISTGSSDQFIPGHTYVLFVDGFGGSVCDFNIAVTEGMSSENNPFMVVEPTHFTNSIGSTILFGDTIDFCKDGYFTTTLNGSTNADAYIWSIVNNGGLEIEYLPSDMDTVDLIFTKADSLYQICAVGVTDCDDSETNCFYVQVTAEPNDTLGLFEYCMDDLTKGVMPTDWEGEEIKNEGLYYHTVVDTIQGCTHYQIVTVQALLPQIETLNTVYCGLDTIFYNGDTITGQYFEKQYHFEDAAINGCDSILNYSVERFNFSGELSELLCLDNNQFGLEISISDQMPADADSLVVLWFKNDVPFTYGLANELELLVNETADYSAVVTIYKNGKTCIFDLNEVAINELISADFQIEVDSICIKDSLIIIVDEFNALASYEFSSGDEIIELSPGIFQIKWLNSGVYDLGLKVIYQSCEVNSTIRQIYVEDQLDTPFVQCVSTSNDSIFIEWQMVDCATNYEIWLDGALISTENSNSYSFLGLNEGQDYEIKIVALSECLCPAGVSITNCTTDNCPNDVELFFDQLPFVVCEDEFINDIALTGFVTGSTGGNLSWNGNIVDGNGIIKWTDAVPGNYPITLSYVLDNCQYDITDTFKINPSVDFDLDYFDVSCYYNQDGEININPIQGTAPFNILLNDNPVAGLQISDLDEGDYIVEFTDANNCNSTETISISKPTEPEVEINGITLIERGQTYNYELSIGNISYDSVVWYVPELDMILCEGLCDEVSYAPVTDQQLCIEIFYDNECSIDTCIDIRVNRDVNLFIPNVFTPGKKDGLNDFFMFKTNAYQELKVVNFSIFDRWGSIVFLKENQTISADTDESFGWDGSTDGKDAMAGVYVYYIEVEDSKGNILQYFGDLTLIR